MEKIFPKIVKDIEKSRFRSWSRDTCQFLDGFGEFGLRKKISVLVSENLVSDKKSRFWFRSKFWYRHSVLCKLCLQPHIYHPSISIIMQIWDNHERAGSWHFYVSKTVTQIIQNIYLRTKRILLRIKKK